MRKVTQEVTISEKIYTQCRELNLGYHLLGMSVGGLSEKPRETWSERFSHSTTVARTDTGRFSGATAAVQQLAPFNNKQRNVQKKFQFLKKEHAWHQLRTFSPTYRPRTTLKPVFSSSWAKTGSKKQKSGFLISQYNL